MTVFPSWVEEPEHDWLQVNGVPLLLSCLDYFTSFHLYHGLELKQLQYHPKKHQYKDYMEEKDWDEPKQVHYIVFNISNTAKCRFSFFYSSNFL